ncbi:8199_t:CDS:2, partial [Paraglomus occultum]
NQQQPTVSTGHEIPQSLFPPKTTTQFNKRRQVGKVKSSKILPLSSPEPSEDKRKGADEYTLNVGVAIRTIRSDLPRFFERGLSDTSIYSQNILLSEPYHTRLYVRGKHLYVGIANLLRWSLTWYFDDIVFEIINMRVVDANTDEKDNDEGSFHYPLADEASAINSNSVKPLSRHNVLPTTLNSPSNKEPSERDTRLFVRWTFEGTPRASYFWSLFSSSDSRIPRSTFSGVFMYMFDARGYVSEHWVKSIIPAPSRRAVLYHGFGGLGGWLWRIRSLLRQQKGQWGVGLGMVGIRNNDENAEKRGGRVNLGGEG